MALDPIDYMYKDPTITSNSVIQGKDASQLDMNDFFNLLVAQLTNQDMMNPTNDTEFIAQMAQFSALQGVQTIQEYQLSSYASSYIGKFVTIANVTESGEMETILGKVSSITYYDGNPKVVVEGKAYDLFTVMEINESDGSGALAQATKLKGKEVTVEQVDDEGVRTEITGTVTNAGIANGAPYITVNGKNYALDTILEIEGMSAKEYWDSLGMFGNGGDEVELSESEKMKSLVGHDVAFSGYDVGGLFANQWSGSVTAAEWRNGSGYVTIGGEEYKIQTLNSVDWKDPSLHWASMGKSSAASTQTKAQTQTEAQPMSANAYLGGYGDSLFGGNTNREGVNPLTGQPYRSMEELMQELNDMWMNDYYNGSTPM